MLRLSSKAFVATGCFCSILILAFSCCLFEHEHDCCQPTSDADKEYQGIFNSQFLIFIGVSLRCLWFTIERHSDGFLASFTIILAVVTTALAIYTAKLAAEAAKGGSIAEIAAIAAQRSADIAEKSLTVVQRPRLFADVYNLMLFDQSSIAVPIGNEYLRFPSVTYCFRNYGKSPAFIIEVRVELHFGLLPEARVFHHSEVKNGEQIVAADQSSDELICRFYRDLSASEEAGRLQIENRFFVFGYVKYNDIFGDLREMGFCYKAMPTSFTKFIKRGNDSYNYEKQISYSEDEQPATK